MLKFNFFLLFDDFIVFLNFTDIYFADLVIFAYKINKLLFNWVHSIHA